MTNHLARHVEMIPILPEFDAPISLFDTDPFPCGIEQGERAAEALLPCIRDFLEAFEPMDGKGRNGAEWHRYAAGHPSAKEQGEEKRSGADVYMDRFK
jgi:hypothetical protein